jgi:hypothetical protein
MMPAAGSPSMLEAALQLAAVGYPVFPCHTPRVTERGTHCSCARADCSSIGKHPRTLKGCLDATTDAEQVRAWWSKWPDANVAIATSNELVVLDVDPDKGGTSNGRDLPDTIRSVTGSGGEHWYLQGDGERVPNSVELVGPGLDIRGEGGYVLAPPSLHKSGRRYEWDAGGGETLGAAPAWLLTAARSKRISLETLDGSPSADAVVTGGRNDALTRLAGTMRRYGFGAPAITAALIQENAARCRPPLDEPEVRRIAEGIARRYPPGVQVRGSTVLRWSELSLALADVPWLCKDLSIAPGAPTLVAGYGYSGKTVSLQALAMAVATGRKAWGRFAVAQGNVLHLDYEQGRHLTQLRYQRLALAMGIWDEQDLARNLDLLTLPPTYLDAPGELERLVQLCEGRRLCVIDSLKAAFPSADENSSDVRQYLDALTRVSDTTGCVMLVIHHARKPSKDHEGMAAMAVRGSGAIFDACAGVFLWLGRKGQPTTVVHDKARFTGRTVEDFSLEVVDVALPVESLTEPIALATKGDGIASETGSMRMGLRVACVTPEEQTAISGTRDLERRLMQLIEQTPGVGGRRLREKLGARHASVQQALGLLQEDGRILVEHGPGKVLRYFPLRR